MILERFLTARLQVTRLDGSADIIRVKILGVETPTLLQDGVQETQPLTLLQQQI